MKRLAVDIGGTFTDITYTDEETMKVVVDKAKTNPKNLEEGVLQVIQKTNADMAEVGIFVHGTTVGMNTLVQKKGSKTGLITTKGFRDVLEFGRTNRIEQFNFFWQKPEPLVPRYLRLEVSERTNYRGEIIEKLNEKEVEEAVRKLRENSVEAIGVCLLHSYANPDNEQRIEEIINRLWPEMTVSLSSRIVREYREFERTSTTVLDTYIKQTVGDYLDRLLKSIESMNFKGQALVMSTAGALTFPMAREKSITTIVSGPTGGAFGSSHIGKSLGIKNILTVDVGGTSFDISLISDGKNVEREEADLIGYPMIIPSIDIRTIGAGGGSIARVDSAGLLHVGPESAGALPGPMCYGMGGTEPTVTDAALVNGLIDPNYFLGGEILLDTPLAEEGVKDVANRLGLNINEAADGILTVAKDNMATSAREILIGKGYDPRDFTMIAFGGAGGIFAGSIAKDINISRIVVPLSPGVFSARGMLSTNITHNFIQTYICLTDDLKIQTLIDVYQRMEAEALDILSKEGLAGKDIELVRSVDMRYEGQGHNVETPISISEFSEDSKLEIEDVFHRLHENIYGHRLNYPTQIINFRLKAIGKIKEMPFMEIKEGSQNPPDVALKPSRKVYMGDKFEQCRIYERDRLLYGNVINGPAIIEEPAHTTVVMPGQRLNVDKVGNLIINV